MHAFIRKSISYFLKKLKGEKEFSTLGIIKWSHIKIFTKLHFTGSVFHLYKLLQLQSPFLSTYWIILKKPSLYVYACKSIHLLSLAPEYLLHFVSANTLKGSIWRVLDIKQNASILSVPINEFWKFYTPI